jgi:hypothetical protein
MNERIKAIGRQAGFAFIEDGVYGDRWYSSKCGMDASEFEKFAQLIVLECARVVKASSPQGMIGVNAIRIHFGVEP